MSTTNRASSNSNASVPAPRAKSGKWRWLWLGLGLTGVAILSASAGALLAVAIAGTTLMQSDLSPDDAGVFSQKEISTGANFRLPKLTRPVNILVLGVKVLASDVSNPPPGSLDLGYDPTINSLEGLSDSMLLIRFNPELEQLTVLSLPRDTRTYVDGAGVTKLNEANAIGGPALAARSSSDLLGGVGIDRYIRINVQGVEKLIDALGGVKLYVPHDMKYQDDSQHLYINLKQGEQRLNGAQAVQFLRFRYDANGDIGRVQRQQTFIRALKEQALQPATLARLPQILSVIQANLDTNLNVEELIALAGFGSQIDRSKMQMLMLPGTFSAEGEYAASYWLPNQPQIAKLVRQYFGMTSPHFSAAEGGASDHVTIAIQDSTTTVEAVEKLMNRLGSLGYGDIFVDESWSEPLTTTQIIAQQGNGDEATAIQQSLGFGEVLVESTGSLQSDITIRLGEDALEAAVPVDVLPAESVPGAADTSSSASSNTSPSPSLLPQSDATPLSTPPAVAPVGFPQPQPVPTKATLPLQPTESPLRNSVPASSPPSSLEASPVVPGALPASIETIPAAPEPAPDAGSPEE